MKKKIVAAILAIGMVMGLAACGGNSGGSSSAASSAASGGGTLKLAASFAYASLDVHKESYGWYTSIYGVSESLFKLNDNAQVESCLAKDAVAEGNKWTITLNDNVSFSDGDKLTAEMVMKNLKRAAEVNKKFKRYGEYTMTVKDEKTLVIDTGDTPYPMLKNELATPELGIMDLDHTSDFDHNPICTGPFTIKEFKEKGDVTVVRNEKYWGGKVELDGATFLYMQDDETKLTAMQAGELDGYNSVSADAMEVYKKDADKYTLESIQGSRLQFYILNNKTLSEKVRKAINLTVDKKAIETFLKGSVSAATSPYPSSTAYSKVNIPATDAAAAKKLLEEDGYTMGSDGYYAKGGKKLSITCYCYKARSLDKIAVLMQEQLKAVGIEVEIKTEEDADATYIKDRNYDIALYCMIADKYADPQYFIDTVIAADSSYNGGFESAECTALMKDLAKETDTAKRAELATKIVQMAIDSNTWGFVGLFNHTTVLKKGVSGFAEKSPYDFYGINAQTKK